MRQQPKFRKFSLFRWAGIMLCPFALSGCIVASEKSDFNTALIAPKPAKTATGTTASPIHLDIPSPCGTSDPTNKQTRNDCIYHIKSAIDDSYLNYRLHVAKQIGLTAESLDISSSASSAAATATTGIANKVLSGLTSAITGSRSAFNNDALYTQSIQVIFKQMDADVANSWAHMQISMQSEITQYSMAQAENDLFAYFRAGTIEDALGSLDATAGTAATTCKAASSAVNTATSSTMVKVQSSATPGTLQQAASATTTTDQCAQILQSANAALAMAVVQSPDVASEEAKISKNIKAIAEVDKPLLDKVAHAFHVPVSDFTTERGNIVYALANINDPAKLGEMTDQIKADTGKDFTQ